MLMKKRDITIRWRVPLPRWIRRAMWSWVTICLALPAAVAQEWSHTWGGPKADSAGSVTVDLTGNTYLTGATSSFGAGGQDVLAGCGKTPFFGQIRNSHYAESKTDCS
jgi:hypothetical protein